MANEHDTQQGAVLKQKVWDKVWDLVLPALEQLKEIQGKELVLVLGATGSGKTTLANYLAGVPLEEKIRRGRRGNQLVIDVVTDYEGPALKIGHKRSSTTEYPQWIAGDSSSSHRVYCDLPGFGDTRGEAQRIAASILTKIVLSYCQGITGVVVMFNVEDFNRDGKDFFDRFSCLSRFIASPGQSRGLVHCVVKDRNYLKKRQKWEKNQRRYQAHNMSEELQQQRLINKQEKYQRMLRNDIRAGLDEQERFLIDRMHRVLLSSLEARRSAEGGAMQKITEQAWACCQQLSCLGHHIFGLGSVSLDENIADEVQSALEDKAQLDLLRLMTGSIWVDYVAVEDAAERQKVEELWAARQPGPKDFLVICEQVLSHSGAAPRVQWSLRGKTAEGGEACLSVETQQALTELLAQYSVPDEKGEEGSAITDMILAMRELIAEEVGYGNELDGQFIYDFNVLDGGESAARLEAVLNTNQQSLGKDCFNFDAFARDTWSSFEQKFIDTAIEIEKNIIDSVSFERGISDSERLLSTKPVPIETSTTSLQQLLGCATSIYQQAREADIGKLTKKLKERLEKLQLIHHELRQIDTEDAVEVKIKRVGDATESDCKTYLSERLIVVKIFDREALVKSLRDIDSSPHLTMASPDAVVLTDDHKAYFFIDRELVCLPNENNRNTPLFVQLKKEDRICFLECSSDEGPIEIKQSQATFAFIALARKKAGLNQGGINRQPVFNKDGFRELGFRILNWFRNVELIWEDEEQFPCIEEKIKCESVSQEKLTAEELESKKNKNIIVYRGSLSKAKGNSANRFVVTYKKSPFQWSRHMVIKFKIHQQRRHHPAFRYRVNEYKKKVYGIQCERHRLGLQLESYILNMQAARAGKRWEEHRAAVDLQIMIEAKKKRLNQVRQWLTQNKMICLQIANLQESFIQSSVPAIDNLQGEYKNRINVMFHENEDRTPTDQSVVQSFVSDYRVEESINRRQDNQKIFELVLKGDVEELKRSLAHNSDLVNITSLRRWSLLHYAVVFEQATIVRLLLDLTPQDARALCASCDCFGWTPLHFAVLKDNVEFVAMLLDQGGADLECRTDQGETPLLIAVQLGYVGMVKYLLNHGSKYKQVYDNYGNTLLDLAAARNNKAVLEYLLQHPKVQAREIMDSEQQVENFPFKMVLEVALTYDALESAQILLESSGRKVPSDDFIEQLGEESKSYYYINLLCACREKRVVNDETIKKHEEAKITTYIAKCRELDERSWKTQLEELESKQDSNAEPDHIDVSKVYGLTRYAMMILNSESCFNLLNDHLPVLIGKLEAVVRIFQSKNLEDERVRLQAEIVVFKDKLISSYIVRFYNKPNCENQLETLLATLKVDVYHIDKHGHSLLHRVAQYGDFTLLNKVHKLHTYNVSQETDEGITALHYAARRGDIKIVKALVEMHGCKQLADINGKMPVHYAIEQEKWDVAELLINKIENTKLDNIRDNEGRNILHYLSRIGAVEKFEEWVEKGLILTSTGMLSQKTSEDEETALHYAVRFDHPEMIKSLLRYSTNDHINMRNKLGDKLVHVAMRHDRISTFKVFLEQLETSNEGRGRKMKILAQWQQFVGPFHCKKISNLITNKINALNSPSSPSQVLKKGGYTHLVFQGGGVRGIAYIGALKELINSKALDLLQVKHVAGTSAGAITALLLSLGYTVSEIDKEMQALDFMSFLDKGSFKKLFLKLQQGEFRETVGEELYDYCKNLKEKNITRVALDSLRAKFIPALKQAYNNLKKASDINKALQDNYGVFSGKQLEDLFGRWVYEKTRNKSDNDSDNTSLSQLTFKRLQELSREPNSAFKELYVVAYDAHSSDPEKAIVRYSADDTPDVSVIKAVRASMAIPLFFTPTQIASPSSRRTMVDGGLVANYLIEIFDEESYRQLSAARETVACKIYNPNVLGFRLLAKDKNNIDLVEPKKVGLKKLLMNLIMGIMDSQTYYYSNSSNKKRSIEIDTFNVGAVDFNLTAEAKSLLILSGRNAAGIFLKQRHDVQVVPPKIDNKVNRHSYIVSEEPAESKLSIDLE